MSLVYLYVYMRTIVASPQNTYLDFSTITNTGKSNKIYMTQKSITLRKRETREKHEKRHFIHIYIPLTSFIVRR